jgi:hypothetical protein
MFFQGLTDRCRHLKIQLYLVLISIVLTAFLIFPVHADTFRMMEGDALQYKYERISSTGEGQTGNVTFTIASLNQTAVTLQVNATSGVQAGALRIRYSNGIPVYAERLEALVYLPPECVAESLRGKLDWAANLQSGTLATVTNETSRTQGLTVTAGSFQTLNLTLSLVGWEYGTLTLIYSVDSGVLVYEQWIPSPYGDIIIQELTALTYPLTTKQTLLDFVLPTATLILPAAIAVGEARKALHKRKAQKRGTSSENGKPANHRRTSLYIGLTGALLMLTSVSLPWSQPMGSQVYLPSSLPTLIARSALLSLSTSDFLITSLVAHSTAILAWLSVVVKIYTERKPTAQLIAVASALTAFASTAILIQAGWSLSWGSLIIIAGGVLMLTSVLAMRRKNNTKNSA